MNLMSMPVTAPRTLAFGTAANGVPAKSGDSARLTERV
jgi:hypothetical protein